MAALLLTGILAYGQESTFTYTEVVRIDSATSEMLYKRSRQWVDTTYASVKSVMKTNDSVNSTISINAAFVVNVSDGFVRDGGYVKYSLTIECKDGRYKLSISDFVHHHGNSDLGEGGDLNRIKPACSLLNLPRYYWHQIKDQATEHRNKLIASVKRALGFNPIPAGGSDW